MAFELTPRQRRLLDTLLILGTIALAFVVIGYLGFVFSFFGDVILVFFLAWILAFILSPIVSRLTSAIPLLPRAAATILVYAVLLGGLILLAIYVAGALASSIGDFVGSLPDIQNRLPQLLDPWQRRLTEFGLGQINLVGQASTFLRNVNQYAETLVGPLQQIAVASLGAIGNLILVLVLSLYMVIDRDRILSFFYRLVPPNLKEQARLLQTSVGRSFGGFLRGQAIVGVVYGLIAGLTNAIFALPYGAVTAALSGFLMAIPFFGPFASWAPPVLVALLVVPNATVPVLIVMGIGWFIVMNVIQPRVMSQAVGIHPIVVLASVLIGSKIAGVPGAVFGIPIAAVISAFFFEYVGRSYDLQPVTQRAARRLEAREGRRIRVPREPAPGVDPDVDEPVVVRTRPPVPRHAPSPESGPTE